MSRAIVIGSGVAGLASAIRLARMGYAVTIFERNSYPGGKMTTIQKDGYRFDAGPSLFTLPHLVDELYEFCGLNPKDHFKYLKKDEICNYFWEDGTTFNASAFEDQFAREASMKFDEPEYSIKKYLASSRKKYDLTSGIFLSRSLHRTSTYTKRDTLKTLMSSGGLGLFRSLHKENAKTFRNPKLIQLFDRYATYNGSSPYETPGIMSMIPHLEMGIGTFFPVRGMHGITEALVELAENMGVTFVFNSHVDEVVTSNNRVLGIKADGRFFEADVVVCNMDVFTAYRTILKDQPQPKRVLKQQRSTSALIFYWGIKQEFPELDLHNILFSDHYREEFEFMFNKHDLHPDPTVYINITSKEKKDDAPRGHENWFVMINAPGNVGQDWSELKSKARKNIVDKINRILKVDIESLITTEEVLDPVTIESRTMSHEGSLYGSASNTKFAAFFRHPNFSSTVKNLFFCGGSVHPGGGIPLCLNSAKIMAECVADMSRNG